MFNFRYTFLFCTAQQMDFDMLTNSKEEGSYWVFKNIDGNYDWHISYYAYD